MGAPPGIGSSTSAPPPDAGIPSRFPPPPGGPAASPPADSTAFGQPLPVAAPLKPDEIRLRLAQGLRLYSDNHLDTARQTLQGVGEDPLGKAILGKIEDREARFRSIQASAVLKALAADYGRQHDTAESEKQKLGEALADIEAQLLSKPSASWSESIETAKKGFSAEVLKAWENFATGEKSRLKELESLFKEKDRELLATGLMNLAERLRQQHYYSTSWTLAQMAVEFPGTQKKAQELIDHLEGQRSTTEYVISDMFDQGGTSMAINLLSLYPAVAGARRISTWSRLAAKSFWLRYPAALAGGSSIHWGSTKGLMLATGYNGQIMPRSWGEFGTEMGSSALQTGTALFLANRFWKLKPAAKTAVAETETAGAATFRQRVWSGLGKGGRGLWWTTKTGMKLGTITAGDLASQWAFHAAGWKDMTPQGFPAGLVKHLLPGVHETRQTVLSTYEARRLLEQHYKTMSAATAAGPQQNVIELGLNLDLFLTALDPSLDGDRREMAYAAFASASERKKFGLNIRRWVLQKKQLGEFGSANKTLERQGIPVRLDQDGFVCFTDSQTFPCP
ncbi:MAG TPA: hypothetical protein VJP40_09375 [bacterium]|nr:hypothetical protein [bacterium]